MIQTRSFAALSPKEKLKPYTFNRREPGSHEVLIEILYCGICHSDIHQARNEWGGSAYPMVPGHEIVGRVVRLGRKAKKFREGDLVGIGCFVDSCRKCPSCKEGLEQYCDGPVSWTYNGTEKDGKTPTQGGYSTYITADQRYVLKIPKTIPAANAAPLLCAGITTYSPLKHFGVKKGWKVAVVGLGGLGHMAVKIASAMGAEVTVFSTSPEKAKDAKRLGARHFVVSKPKALEALTGRFDFVLDTVSADHDLNLYLALLKRDRTMVIVGVPEKPAQLRAFTLIGRRKRLAGSVIGGIRENQEMLQFCARHGISADIELIPVQRVNEAYERTIRGDVHYRFVIDLSSLKPKL